ncbi:MAG: hypothetical protein BWK73_46750 [Thiothrix lacustris]|uniref:Cobalt transporter n=1 Tax=Thiothrix lacustris TaxID=525917 RepID=A0A1Y1QAF2_9GAMM|nr:MAG: hypothetical protein BWK73_46750 [Thiothrix lacustris]
MNKLPIHRLLSLLLACLLLAQVAVATVGWHIDFPHQHEHEVAHHSVVLAEHDHVAQDGTVEHHHHCCHDTTANVALPFASFSLPLTETTTFIPTAIIDPYRAPHADLLIRPPIA